MKARLAMFYCKNSVNILETICEDGGHRAAERHSRRAKTAPVTYYASQELGVRREKL